MARLRLFARARDEAGRADDTIDATTLGALLDEACARYGVEFTRVLARSRVWVNGEEPGAGAATPLRTNDEVAVLPPVSGGSDSEATSSRVGSLGA